MKGFIYAVHRYKALCTAMVLALRALWARR
jgi:hypothetical protein